MKQLKEELQGTLEDVERPWIRIPAVLIMFVPYFMLMTILHFAGFFATGCDPDAIFSWHECIASWLDMCRAKHNRKWKRQ